MWRGSIRSARTTPAAAWFASWRRSPNTAQPRRAPRPAHSIRHSGALRERGTTMGKRGNIVVAGSLAQKPGNGGHTWVFLQYLLGLQRLGYSVLFLDELDGTRCVDVTGTASSFERSWNL